MHGLMGNIASWNVAGSRREGTGSQSQVAFHRAANQPDVQHSQSLVEGTFLGLNTDAAQPVMTKFCFSAVNGSQPFQTCPVSTGWLQDLASSVGALKGWEEYANFHRSLKIAALDPKRKREKGKEQDRKRALLIITASCCLSEASGLRMCHFLGGAWESVDTTLVAQNKNHGND